MKRRRKIGLNQTMKCLRSDLWKDFKTVELLSAMVEPGGSFLLEILWLVDPSLSTHSLIMWIRGYAHVL